MLSYQLIKNAIDRLLALFLFSITLPLSIILFLSILLSLREFPLFFQIRNGFRGNEFILVKFKTMRSENSISSIDSCGSHFSRTTLYTRFLRSLRLDELPQLLNIFLGSMSFVGPRPLLPRYYDIGSNRFRSRYRVKPGIMGLAQLYGGEKLSFSRRIPLDIIYINNLSFCLDLKIIASTFFALFMNLLPQTLSSKSITQSEDLPVFR